MDRIMADYDTFKMMVMLVIAAFTTGSLYFRSKAKSLPPDRPSSPSMLSHELISGHLVEQEQEMEDSLTAQLAKDLLKKVQRLQSIEDILSDRPYKTQRRYIGKQIGQWDSGKQIGEGYSGKQIQEFGTTRIQDSILQIQQCFQPCEAERIFVPHIQINSSISGEDSQEQEQRILLPNRKVLHKSGRLQQMRSLNQQRKQQVRYQIERKKRQKQLRQIVLKMKIKEKLRKQRKKQQEDTKAKQGSGVEADIPMHQVKRKIIKEKQTIYEMKEQGSH